uniref:WW domain-containing protein n=1 Tax=Zooxanthella nutricula TaxID=1333877 RepID=A0A6V0C0M2_9DINO|eukprot:CAMPEP_0198547206 /NCGR_PEP_ID=MMETSP1462-20131121/67425_1 /TAXON_ID=1333877 /ORGANISM="Brandtodinium nutriculum, Strain RCC3387" /LENGTH=576 /DNA_ID=CAMNT_0044277683 /DNA_START=35 /DNA_END=1765 /DNA_ORIENTATION=+
MTDAEVQPDIFAGGFFDQERVVNQAEGLQDFRRRQEGHLIIADDRPLLVMSFGTKYQGANASKYKIEGKYDIPVGYKVIIKWDEDEIVFMTRQGSRGFGPEFQIVYLPKSPVPEDFTMFEWNQNIAEIWDQFLKVVEGHEDRDLRLFNQGPWRTFGVTRDEVQVALKQGTDNKTIIDGIMYCSDGQAPNYHEHMRYLGFDPSLDEDFRWVCKFFMEEPLPPNYFQYVNDNGMVYWVDANTGEPTWKHPHYEKYRQMLLSARAQKPLPHWKAIMAFRIEYLLSGIFTWEVEEAVQNGGEYPLVETVENVLEMERIFGIDIKNEPYLVHVLKRALRHYANAVKEKRKVKDVEDFLNLRQRYRDIVGQFEQMREEESKRVQKMKVCVQCDENHAVLFCDQCKDFFCQGCFDALHSKGRRQNHRRTWVEMGMCSECQESIALFHCVQCADLYCRDCYSSWHARGGRRNHVPIILRCFNSQLHILPEAKPALGTGSAKVLAQARSPWFAFRDENGINLYYNIHTNESRRDAPLAVINEPIEENKGGGIAAGWSGTYGANMFSDPLDPTNSKVASKALETAM